MKKIPLLLATSLAMAAQAAPVEVCVMLPKADAEALLGKLVNVTSIKPQGSLLGECTYEGAKASLSVAARPAQEYDATIGAAADKAQPPVPVPGLAGKAMSTKYGLLYQPAGKPYFLQVIGRKGDTGDMALAIEGAKKLRQ
jgi:hypothetical protein